MPTMSHEELDMLLWRYQAQPETLTAAEIALVEQGQSTAQGATAFAVAMGSAGGDAYNPTASYAAKARAAAEFATITLAANVAAKPAPTERQKVRAMGHRDREACRLAAGMPRHEFTAWLWADDAPRQPAASSTPQAVQWAEQVLGGAA